MQDVRENQQHGLCLMSTCSPRFPIIGGQRGPLTKQPHQKSSLNHKLTKQSYAQPPAQNSHYRKLPMCKLHALIHILICTFAVRDINYKVFLADTPKMTQNLI